MTDAGIRWFSGRYIAGPVAAIAIAFFSPADAQDRTGGMSNAGAGKFVVEYVYNYTKRTYTPEITFKAIARNDASYASPEQAFVSHYSAMASGDYEWWLSGWTTEAQNGIHQRNVKMNRTARTWQEIWSKALQGETIKLIERVETGPYVFIVYKMFDASGKATMHSIYACKLVKDKWLATDELSEDLMFHHYLEGKDRVTKNIR